MNQVMNVDLYGASLADVDGNKYVSLYIGQQVIDEKEESAKGIVVMKLPCDPSVYDSLQLSSSGSQTSASSANSSAARSSSKSGAFSSLGEKGEFDGEASEKKMDELKEELDQKIADIKADIQGEFGGTISGTGTIQDFCKNNIHRTEVCFGLKKWEPFLDPISAAIFLVACVMAFSIVLRG